jgi:hypothetical protein
MKLALLILLSFALPAWSATYYIDWDTGSDANNGTSTGTPWKRHPDMKGWAGGAFTAQPGDSFIFKGGVTWPNEALSLYISDNGTAENRIYVGIDTSWHSGDQFVDWTNGNGETVQSFNYPVLDAGGVDIVDSRNFGGGSSGTRNNIVAVDGDYITIEGLHIKGVLINDNLAGGTPPPDAGNDHTLRIFNAVDFIGTGLYLSDWVVETDYGGDVGGAIRTGTSPNSQLINTRIKGPENIDPQYISASNGRDYGNAVQFFDTVQGCDISRTGQGIWACTTVDGNIVHTMGQYTDSAAHENTIWAQNTATIKNNVFRNAGGVCYFLVGWSGSSNTQLIYNNVFFDVPQINLTQQNSSDETNTIRFFNNISGQIVNVGTTKAGADFGSLTISNNVFIMDGDADGLNIVDAGDLGDDYTNENNVVYTNSESSALGMTEGNVYEPQSEIAALVDQGTDFSAISTTDINGVTRSNPPDIGAYEFEAGDPSPGSLTFAVSAYSVGEADGTVTITVNRIGGTAGAVGVSYASADNTAVDSSDYTAVSDTLSWADAEGGGKTFNVTITSDGDEEGNETFFVSISSPTGGAALGGITTAAVTIEDDDGGNPIPLMADLGPFEAESGLIEGIFTVSGGLVFQTTQTTNPASGGLARWRVTIPSTGDYKVTMDVEAAATASDSFFVEWDEEPTSPADIWDIQQITTGVEARDVTLRGAGAFDNPEFNPMLWSLTAGEHTLYVRGREANAKMDNITVSAAGDTAPDPPTNLAVSKLQGGGWELTWTDNSDDEDGFQIERKEEPFDFQVIESVSGNVITYQDIDIEIWEIYTYRVRAFNEFGNSAYTNEALVPTSVAIQAGTLRIIP